MMLGEFYVQLGKTIGWNGMRERALIRQPSSGKETANSLQKQSPDRDGRLRGDENN